MSDYDNNDNNDNTITINSDKYAEEFKNRYNGVANKFLREYLHKKFNEAYDKVINFIDDNNEKNKLKALQNYKVNTRVLGGNYNDYEEPKIVSRSTNFKKKVKNLTGFFTKSNNEELGYLKTGVSEWVNDIDGLNIEGIYMEMLDKDALKTRMKTKLDNIVQNLMTATGGNKTRKHKKSKKNVTRRI